ncbi:MAG TPA: hypothetical protein VLC12_09395 [Terriglobales bacterium]|nr:hypothetical protein [Terriglobales bacterium]
MNGQCNIDIPKLTVWQTDSTTIRWRSDDAPPKTYTVHFDPKDNPNQPKGTPFGPDDNPIYDITTSNNPLTPQRKGDFLYSVRPDTSTSPCIQATDPGLYVK